MKRIISILLCAALAVSLACPVLAAGITAVRSNQAVYVDGKRVELETYNIDGANYVKLRDVGKVLGVNVYWDGRAVQVDTSAPYTGEAPASTFTSSPTPVTQDVEAMRQEIVDRTNAVRIANGLAALPTDPMLMLVAQVRAEENAAAQKSSHTRPDGSSRFTVTDCPYAAENIYQIWDVTLEYKGLTLPKYCVDGWANSPGHFQNMTLSDSGSIGVGVARGVDFLGKDCWYCVEWLLQEGQQITWVDTPKVP